MKLKPVILFLVIIAVAILILGGWYLHHISNLDYYSFYGEQIPSVSYVLGTEQHLSGFSNNTESNNDRQYRYDTHLTIQEARQYVYYLCTNASFYICSETVDQFVLAKVTTKTGQHIIMTINI